jgi:hypothetical protein
MILPMRPTVLGTPPRGKPYWRGISAGISRFWLRLEHQLAIDLDPTEKQQPGLQADRLSAVT